MRRTRWVVAMVFGLLVALAAPADASGQPPLASSDSYRVNAGSGPLVVPAPGILANDVDPEGDPLTVESPGYGEPSHGTLSLGTDGSFTYTPYPGYIGSDYFVYRVFDGTSYSSVSYVSLSVNSAPTATADHFALVNNFWLLGVPAPGLLANDTDPNGDELTVQLLDGPYLGGRVHLYPNGGFLYAPKKGYVGYDAFVYRTFDGLLWSQPTIAYIKIKGSNAAPTPAADRYDLDEDTALIANPLANDTDPDGDPLTAELLSHPGIGELIMYPDGTFEYYPYENFDSDLTFTYRVSDGLVWSAPIEVYIDMHAVNDPPEAYDDYFDTSGLNPVSGNVLGNDFDPVEGDALTAGLATVPQYGALDFHSDGSFVYTPDEESIAAGYDSFSYQACDSTCGGTASVQITIFAE